jgi:hypothetical protein
MSMTPLPSVSKRLKASRISSISSSETPARFGARDARPPPGRPDKAREPLSTPNRFRAAMADLALLVRAVRRRTRLDDGAMGHPSSQLSKSIATRGEDAGILNDLFMRHRPRAARTMLGRGFMPEA